VELPNHGAEKLNGCRKTKGKIERRVATDIIEGIANKHGGVIQGRGVPS
jgi:hypothetical protein